ncbi:ETX/MTX2 family pore-forming toxin [Streptomyces sp. MS1.AVA.1]|uniref:ETX/MTX2 family pore-forming toxin n=1 Tax=Streptomyces machairae TaxID=3134109 RepID=A0ABU8UFV3_9ACTN
MPAPQPCEESYDTVDPADPKLPGYQMDDLPRGFSNLQQIIKDAYLTGGVHHHRKARTTRDVDANTDDIGVDEPVSKLTSMEVADSFTENLSDNTLQNGSPIDQTISTSAFSKTYYDSDTATATRGISDTGTITSELSAVDVGKLGASVAHTISINKARSCTTSVAATYTSPGTPIIVPPHKQVRVVQELTRGDTRGRGRSTPPSRGPTRSMASTKSRTASTTASPTATSSPTAGISVR